MSNARETEKLKADILAVHGRVLTLQCEYELSLLFLEESTNISIAVYGKEHATVAGCYNNLGSVSRKLGNYNEAKVYYKKALNIIKYRAQVYRPAFIDFGKYLLLGPSSMSIVKTAFGTVPL